MPRIFGVELKPWMYWAAGGVGLLVIVMMMRRRSSGQAGGAITPVPGYGGMAGGGAPSVSPSVSGSDAEGTDEYARQLQDLTLKEREAAFSQRQKMFELQYEQEGILSRLFTGVAESEAALEREQLEAERKAAAVISERAEDLPVKCPPGMHPVNMPGVGVTCRQLGDEGGGRGFNPIRQIGAVLEGILTGAAFAAPTIGYGAAQYGAVQAGILPPPRSRTQRQPRPSRGETEPATPYRLSGYAAPGEGGYYG